MASEIRVDKINSLSGVGTVTLSPTGVDIAGITTAETLKATTGIVTSLTATTGIVTTLTTNTLTANSTAKVGSGITLSPDGDLFVTGVTTATTYSGSAASLTNVPAANVVGVHTSLTVTNATTTGSAVVGAAVTITESGIEASGIGITCANINGAQIGGRKNIIINGAMKVAQRGTSFTNISDTGVIGSVDRIVMVGANLDELAFAGKQTSDGPDGFSKCFEFDVTTAENALDANDLAYIRYKVEGQDLTHLFNANGTGKDFTLSFYVKAYQAGTYQLNIYKNQGPRFISKTYTVDASATWQRIVIPFTGDTSTAGMNDNNGNGFQIAWILVAGTNYTSGSLQNWGGWPGNTGFAAGQAVNVASSADNYFRITGIQLELGSQATAFEHRSYGEELALCQRYLFKNINENGEVGCNYGKAFSSTEMFASVRFPVAMRTAPTIIAYGNAGTAGTVHKLGSPDKTYTGIDRFDVYGGMRFNGSNGTWATGDTDMYSFTFQADAEL